MEGSPRKQKTQHAKFVPISILKPHTNPFPTHQTPSYAVSNKKSPEVTHKKQEMWRPNQMNQHISTTTSLSKPRFNSHVPNDTFHPALMVAWPNPVEIRKDLEENVPMVW